MRRSSSLPDLSSLRQTAQWHNAGRAARTSQPRRGEPSPEGVDAWTGATAPSPQQTAFVQRLLELTGRHEQAFTPEAGLALLDGLIDLLDKEPVESHEQVRCLLVAASTAQLRAPYVPFLAAVMECLVAVQDRSGAALHDPQRLADLQEAIQAMVPALNGCSASEQMIVVCAYIQACVALSDAEKGPVFLRLLRQALCSQSEQEPLTLDMAVWIELDAAIVKCCRRVPAMPRQAVPREAVADAAASQAPVVMFDMSMNHGMPAELQQLIASLLLNAYGDAWTQKAWQEMGRVIDAASLVNKAFHAGTRLLMYAKALERWRHTPRPVASVFAVLNAPGDELPRAVDALTRHSTPLSAGHCLEELACAVASIRHASNALEAQQLLLDLIQRELTMPSVQGSVPYAVLPTLLVAHSPLWERGVPHVSAFLCFQVLVANLRDMPERSATPALLEAALRALKHERCTGGAVRVVTPSGSWRSLSASEVLRVLNTHGYPVEKMAPALNALATVLACAEPEVGDEPDESTVMQALRFMADCPYPLVGSLAEALKIIQRRHLTASNADLVADCTRKLVLGEFKRQGIEQVVIGPDADSLLLDALLPSHRVAVGQNTPGVQRHAPQ